MSESLLIVSKPIAGVSFGLSFTRDGDRFAHQVFARPGSANSDIILYSSIEGDNNNDWPPSPPFQDLHRQEIANQQVIMAVGMAGNSHWSAACTLQESDTKVGFHFDLACRVDHEAGWLGSSYLKMLQAGESPHDEFEISLVPLAVEESLCQIATQESQIRIEADLGVKDGHQSLSPKSPTRTIRWQYLLEFARKSY